MKLIQVSDLHFVPPEAHLHGLDPRARLEAAIADINAAQGDAELCVFTGDLVDNGALEAYAALGEALAGLNLPYRLLIGNHDDRDNFGRAFPEAPRDEHGFVQSVVRATAGDLILLDTHEPGERGGRFCAERQAWLEARLAEAGARPVYIFMHHPPFDIGIPSLDLIRLAEPAGFARVVAEAGSVKHIFFGPGPRPVGGAGRGRRLAAVRATGHRGALDWETEYPVTYSLEPPNYAVILIEDERVLVHLHDYLDDTAGAVERARP